MHNDSIIKALLYFPVFTITVFLWGHLILQRILKIDLKLSFHNFVFFICTGFVYIHLLMFTLTTFKLLYPTTVIGGIFSILIYPFFNKSLYFDIKLTITKTYTLLLDTTVLQKIIFFGIFLILVTFFLDSLTSPIGGQGDDVLRYHFTALKEFIRCHKFVYMPDIIHTNSPFAIDFLFLPGLMLGGALSAQLTSWLLFCCLIISVLGLSKALIENPLNKEINTYPELSAIIVAITPLFFRFSGTCFIDNGLALFVVTAVWSFYMFGFTNNIKWIILGSLYLGIAVGSKYTSLFLFPGLVLSYFITHGKTILNKKTIIIFTIISLNVVLIGGLWYAKNYVYTGNPVFPAFSNIFGSNQYWSCKADSIFVDFIKTRGFGMGKSLSSLLLIPWNFTIYSEKFHNWQTITPLYLSLAPAILFIIRKRHYRPLLLISISFSLLWFYFDQEARFISPILPFWAILIHSGVNSIIMKYQKTKRYIQILIIISTFFSIILALKQLKKDIPVLTFKITNLEYQKQNMDYPQAYELINQTMKKNDKILMLKGSTESGLVRYYVDQESMVFISDLPEMCGFKTSPENLQNFLTEVKEKKFNYLLDVENHIKNLPNRKDIEVVGKGDGWVLYHIKIL